MSGVQKAAALLVAIGEQRASEIFRHLGETEVEALSLEIAKARKVPAEVCKEVVSEAVETVMAEEYIADGGVDFARSVLERSLGSTARRRSSAASPATIERRPFEFLRRTPAEQIRVFLRNEAPQTIALIVANLHTSLAAQVLAQLEPEDQADVARRVARMGETRPEVVAQIEAVMKQKLSSVSAGSTRPPAASSRSPTSSTTPTARPSATCSTSSRATTASWPRRSACCCSPSRTSSSSTTARSRWCSRRSTRRTSRSPCAASRRRSAARIFSNMSERGAELLKEEIDFQPPQRKRVIEEAQGRIVAVVRRLEDAGAIIISRGAGGDDELM